MENTEKKEKKKFQFKMPHTYVILISIMVLMLVLTHIIPAGEYDRVEDPVSGKMVVVADSYHEIDVERPRAFLTCSWPFRRAMWMRPISCS